MADGSTHPAKPAHVRDARFEGICEGCNAITRYSLLNDDMLCEECCPYEDPESVIDCSDAAMLAEHGTWF